MLYGARHGCYTYSVLLPQLFLTLILLVVCSFAPGFLLVRRLRWSGLEKLCGSVALSLVLLWLAAWGIYIFAAPAAFFGLAAACGVAGHRRRQGRLAARSRTARPARPCRLRTPPGLDPARAGRHPQLFRRLLERRLAGTFPANFVLPPPLRQGHAHFRLSAAGAPAHDERAGGVLSGRDAGSL